MLQSYEKYLNGKSIFTFFSFPTRITRGQARCEVYDVMVSLFVTFSRISL